MSSTDNTVQHPFMPHLLKITSIQFARMEAAGEVAASAVADAAEAERTWQKLDGIARVALAEQHAAEQRYEAARETIRAAEVYAAGLGPADTEKSDAVGPGPENNGAPRQDAGPQAVVRRLILDVLEPGQEIALPELYAKVQALRPDATENGIRAALTPLQKAGRVENVRRGVYRLLEHPEELPMDE